MHKNQTGNREWMRELNTSLVLDLVRQSDSISQADIARRTHLSPGTVTSIIRELKERNYVKEIGHGKSDIGRRPTLLQFNPEAQYVISVEFYADEMHIGILDLGGRIKKDIYRPVKYGETPEVVFRSFAEGTTSLLRGVQIDKNRILGIGVSFEGIVNSDKGELILCNRFGWCNVPVREYIEKELELPTHVENDVCSMLLGEQWYGAGNGASDLVLIDIDAGVGAVSILGGHIYRGMNNMAGEIGHTLAITDGPECKCGKRGCLEAVASGEAILYRIRKGLKEGRKSIISPELVNSPSTRIAVRGVFEAARKGDEFALRLINEAGYYLGLATAAVINYIAPEMIIFMGCVIHESKGMLLKIIREVAQKQIFNVNSRNIKMGEGSLGKNAALIGAATLVYRDIFKLPFVHE